MIFLVNFDKLGLILSCSEGLEYAANVLTKLTCIFVSFFFFLIVTQILWFLVMKCLEIATLLLVVLEPKIILGHGEQLMQGLLFQEHLLENSNLSSNQC